MTRSLVMMLRCFTHACGLPTNTSSSGWYFVLRRSKSQYVSRLLDEAEQFMYCVLHDAESTGFCWIRIDKCGLRSKDFVCKKLCTTLMYYIRYRHVYCTAHYPQIMVQDVGSSHMQQYCTVSKQVSWQRYVDLINVDHYVHSFGTSR